MKRIPPRLALVALCTLVLAPAAAGLRRPGAGVADDGDLTDLSLEQLMDLQVTIASRSAEKMSHVPGAVYVITGDELRRSGHSSIAEALRMVPGFHVSHWTTGAWDVTSRGFGPGLSLTSLAYLNQLLVMIDGVVVYTPLFAGVWWPLQDVDIADVERIEIIRGPGGILWGSNAVHGVVNIITKKPTDTLGPRVSLRGGTDDRQASVRYGGKLGESGAYRVWIRGTEYDTLSNPFLGLDYDWNLLSGGVRADWHALGHDFSLWSRAYNGDFKDEGFDLVNLVPIQVTDEKHGYEVFGSMSNPEGTSRWQAWYMGDRQDLPTLADISIDVFDFEYQRVVRLSDRESLSLGAGYRLVSSDLRGADPTYLAFDPANSTQNTYRVYGLDRIQFPDQNVTLTLGATVEHNDFTQFEVQPTARLSWTPKDDLMFWGAISRAVRTPSLEERHLSSGSYFVGSDQFHSEILWAYELGMRAIPADWVSADLALYYNDYDQLEFADYDPNTFQYFLSNGAKGHALGAELALDLQLTKSWKIRSAYTIKKGEYQTLDGQKLSTDDYSPERTANLRSYLDLGKDWELDLGLYLVDGLGPSFQMAEYFRGDARVGWHPRKDLEVFIGVQNATKATHSELDQYDQVRRTFYGGINWSPGSE